MQVSEPVVQDDWKKVSLQEQQRYRAMAAVYNEFAKEAKKQNPKPPTKQPRQQESRVDRAVRSMQVHLQAMKRRKKLEKGSRIVE